MIDIIDSDSESTSIYDPRYAEHTTRCGARMAACPHLRTSLMLYVFLPELLNMYRSESVLMLQATSRALACFRSLQLPSAWLRPAAPMHCPRYIPVGAVPSYMHTGPPSRRSCFQPQDVLLPPICSPNSPPQERLSPATEHAPPRHPPPRYTPLGAVLSCCWALRTTSRSR
jgi:hypothetical protein